MRLEKWKQLMGYKNCQLSQAFKISPAMVTRILKNQRKPSPTIALRIVKATDGAVTLEDLYNNKV